MAKRVFKFGGVGQDGHGPGWIGDRHYPTPCIVEFDDSDPDDAAHIKLLEKAGSVVVELTKPSEPEPDDETRRAGDMTLAELREFATEHDIPHSSNMRKAQMIELVSVYMESE